MPPNSAFYGGSQDQTQFPKMLAKQFTYNTIYLVRLSQAAELTGLPRGLFSTFPMPWLINRVPCVLVTPTKTLFLLQLYSCNFTPVWTSQQNESGQMKIVHTSASKRGRQWWAVPRGRAACDPKLDCIWNPLEPKRWVHLGGILLDWIVWERKMIFPKSGSCLPSASLPSLSLERSSSCWGVPPLAWKPTSSGVQLRTSSLVGWTINRFSAFP